MAYTFYMDGVQLPITPSKLQIKIKNQNKTINLISEGEVNILKTPGLTEVSFDVSIPQNRYPFARYPDGFKRASFYLDKFEQLKLSKQPFQFLCERKLPDGRLLYDTNLTVALEEYTISEEAKDGFDLTVSVKLKQYRYYGTKVITVEENKIVKVELKRDIEHVPNYNFYTVQAGDTLPLVARKTLGDEQMYLDIYKLNTKIIEEGNEGTDGGKYTIYVGQVLILP